MSRILLWLGGFLVASGALSVYLGFGVVLTERGWTQVIAGATVLTGGVITIALSFVLAKLEAIHQALGNLGSYPVSAAEAVPAVAEATAPTPEPKFEPVEAPQAVVAPIPVKVPPAPIAEEPPQDHYLPPSNRSPIVKKSAVAASVVVASAAVAVAAEKIAEKPVEHPADEPFDVFSSPDFLHEPAPAPEPVVIPEPEPAPFVLPLPVAPPIPAFVPPAPISVPEPEPVIVPSPVAVVMPKLDTLDDIEAALEAALAAPMPPASVDVSEPVIAPEPEPEHAPELPLTPPAPQPKLISRPPMAREMPEPAPTPSFKDQLAGWGLRLGRKKSADDDAKLPPIPVDVPAPPEPVAAPAPEPFIPPAPAPVPEPALAPKPAPVEDDWFDRALSGEDDVLVPPPAPQRPVIPPAPAAYRESHPPQPAPEPAPAPAPAPAHQAAYAPANPLEPEPAVIGRYKAGTTSYIMFADGSIEAESEAGIFRFGSMAELKAFIEQGQ